MDQPPEQPDIAPVTNRPGWLAATRLALACALTLSLVPLCWIYVVMVTMLFGKPALLHVGGLVVFVAAVIALNFHLGRIPAIWRRRWWLGGGLLAAWITIAAVAFWGRLGDFVPRGVVLLISVPASLYMVWLTWMFFYPWRWRNRLGWLAVFMVLVAPYWVFLKLEGLTGDNRFNYVWRDWRATRFDDDTQMSTEAGVNELLANVARGDYPQFLGPDRTGVLKDIRLDRDWQRHPPKELWRRPVGAGWSAFAVSGDYALTQEQRNDDECVVCYQLTTGKQVWVHTDAVRFESPMGGLGPRATPTIAGGRVYTLGATGTLNCLDGATGARIWSADILQGRENTYHGSSTSPLVDENAGVVYVCPAGKEGPSLAAYDMDRGELRWSGGEHRGSYASPAYANLDGVLQILVHNEQGLTGHSPDDGQVLWHFPWTNSVVTNASQPIVHAGGENRVLLSTDYGKGAALIHVSRDAASNWQVKQLWTSRHMKTKYCTAILYDRYVYGLDEGILACIDVAEGRRQWKGGRYGHGQLLLAGGLLIILTERGEVVLVEPNPKELRELGRIEALNAKTWNHPALAGPYLLVRNGEEAACYELPLAGSSQ
jgi:outer membrane protein assembly factor BamB